MAKDMEDSNIDIPHLTLQTLWREIKHVRELMESRLDGVEEKLEVRIGDIEKAIDLAHEDSVRVPTEIEKAVGNLRAFHGEKFLGIQRQFEDVEKRTALALQGAKELVAQQNASASQSTDKQEASFSKQIDGQAALLQANTKALEDKIAVQDRRLTHVESKGEGKGEGKKESYGLMFAVAGVIGTVIGAIIGIIGVVMLFYRR